MAEKRKTSPKKVQTARRSRKLTATELKHFHQLLIEKRREIFGNFDEFRNEALYKSRQDATGDLSSMPIHMADIGSDNYEQEFSLNLMDGERKLLNEIDHALERIENKTYGLCMGTAKPISKARLEAKPWAKYSVEFARQIEQGLVTKPRE